jgi:hypothetical protein
MTVKDVCLFETICSQIRDLRQDVEALAKSKPDNPVNKFKLGLINEKLGQANDILGPQFRPFKDFTLFDVDDLPSNSDVMVALSQYLNALENFRSANIHKARSGVNWIWKTTDGTQVRTTIPTRFRTDDELI